MKKITLTITAWPGSKHQEVLAERVLEAYGLTAIIYFRDANKKTIVKYSLKKT